MEDTRELRRRAKKSIFLKMKVNPRFVNELGEVITQGKTVVCVTTGAGNTVNIYKGVFVGIDGWGKARVRVYDNILIGYEVGDRFVSINDAEFETVDTLTAQPVYDRVPKLRLLNKNRVFLSHIQ